MSGTLEPSFERSDILKPKLDHLEINDTTSFNRLAQKVTADLIAKGHPPVSSATAQLVLQALRDALTRRAEEILSLILKFYEGVHVEDVENLAASPKAELLSRLELATKLASSVLQSSTEQIRASLNPHFLPAPNALSEHANQLKPNLFADIDLICTKLGEGQQPRVFFKKGEIFAGNRVARELFTKAKQSLDIIDTYFGPQIFDMLEVSDESVKIRLISEKQPAPVIQAFRAFNQQFNNRVEFRVCAAKDIHDRYIIIDRQQAFHLGHSIKDLGTKDSEIASIPTAEIVRRFEELWSKATTVV